MAQQRSGLSAYPSGGCHALPRHVAAHASHALRHVVFGLFVEFHIDQFRVLNTCISYFMKIQGLGWRGCHGCHGTPTF